MAKAMLIVTFNTKGDDFLVVGPFDTTNAAHAAIYLASKRWPHALKIEAHDMIDPAWNLKDIANNESDPHTRTR